MARILIADDDTAAFEVMSVALTAQGHEVLYAADGQEACDMAVAEQPDLVFLDVMMPIFDGFETCERLRNDPEIPAELPIVFLTSVEPDSRKLDSVRASAYLPKRHMIQDLQNLLVKHLGEKAVPDAVGN